VCVPEPRKWERELRLKSLIFFMNGRVYYVYSFAAVSVNSALLEKTHHETPPAAARQDSRKFQSR
jgi:hypothetical protein